ncbi:energy transducer TonB [Mucilaginibacter sabulilitoris]|uniref:Energy transducer TonB n=1 Tax=Mucilaginibacter sabulilitoris TaxID=1173583 RepID=A0ABZ0TJD2_9SPHI|nr:energy transducer TonB [Mucilaginibacter sabulilitoris]WPU93266.1 energy transducer TonB [Mucilaginibacter sabulilitoris]
MTGRNKISLIAIIVTFLSCFVINNSFAQNSKNTCKGKQDSILHKFVYTTVDIMPEPQNGLKTLSDSLMKHLKYPTNKGDFQGKVIIAFVIEPDGKIDGQRVIRNLFGSDFTFSQQLFKIVKSFKWEPGLCKGKPVPVLYPLPINIGIQE